MKTWNLNLSWYENTHRMKRAEIGRKLARCETYDSHGDKMREIPDELWQEMIAARRCPECARYVGGWIPDLRLVAETPETNRGLECPQCEEFYLLPNLCTWEPCDSPSDADHGL
jgi:hypothetical protein